MQLGPRAGQRIGEPTIRRATRSDVPVLANLAEQTFLETFVEGFAIPYAPADLEIYIEQAHSRAAFLKMFADPAQKIWIAEDFGKRALGYGVAGPNRLPHPDTAAGDGEIKRLYLKGEAQGTGLAARMMKTMMQGIDPTGQRRLWLGVWSGNERAQRFYERYGFAKVGEYEFPVGRHKDHEFIFSRG